MVGGFPVKTETLITPSQASLIVQSYTNRLVIFVSEAASGGSPGTLVEFRREESSQLTLSFGDNAADAEEGDIEPSMIFDLRVLFGAEKPEIILAARVLGARLHQSGVTEKPILFGIGLQRFSKPFLTEIGTSLVKIVKDL